MGENLNKSQLLHKEEEEEAYRKIREFDYTESSIKFLKRAARLKHLPKVEYKALCDRLDGIGYQGDYILYRNIDLFELWEKRKKGHKGIIDNGDGIVVNVDNVLIELTNDAIPGTHQIVTPGLSGFIVKSENNRSSDSKYSNLASKNELFLPYVARQFDVEAATFVEADLKSRRRSNTN